MAVKDGDMQLAENLAEHSTESCHLRTLFFQLVLTCNLQTSFDYLPPWCVIWTKTKSRYTNFVRKDNILASLFYYVDSLLCARCLNAAHDWF